MRRKLITTLMVGILLLTACRSGDSDLTPTPDINLIQTEVVETYAAALTQTAAAQPTLFPTLTASATIPPIVTLASTLLPISQPTVAATKSCYNMTFVSDVTIPDNTPVAPGQTFTKTWKVVNNGSCAWDAGFKFAFVSGDAMSGTAYTLPASVAVNATIDLSIAMTAPTNKTGALQGNWQMSTAGGQFFGNQVYVIVVVGGGTLTPTATGAVASATPSVTPSATPTPTATP
jgi:Ig-like domain from next to BRCA1 gene